MDEEQYPPVPARSRPVVPWIIMAALAGVVLLYVLVRNQQPAVPEGTEHPAVGVRLPKLQLEPLVFAEEAIEMSDVAGQVVLINYWGPWCPPCRVEFPELVELSEDFSDDDHFRLLSVSCAQSPGSMTREELREQTGQFLMEYDYDLPVYSDLDVASRWALIEAADLRGRARAFTFPTTVLIDGQGIIRGLWVGYAPSYAEQMRAAIADLLREAGNAS